MKKVLMIGAARNMKGGISTVINSYYETGLDELVDLEYVETLVEGNNLKKIIFGLKAVIKYLFIIKNYDIIHIHMASRGSFFRKSIFVLIAKIFKKKIILHIHGAEFMVFYKNECIKIIKKYVIFIFNIADKIIALSDQWKSNLTEIVDNNKIVVIRNSILIPKVNENKDYSEANILFLGRIGERKGIYDLINVIEKIVKQGYRFKLKLAGDGDIEKVREICKSKNISRYIDTVGWINGDDKIKLLKESTIFVLPSYNEGLPMSILEAMSYSIPVIATNVGGIPEVVSNKINGYIIKAGDIKNLEESLIRLIEDKNLRCKMGNNAKETISDNFNLERIIKIIVRLYEEC